MKNVHITLGILIMAALALPSPAALSAQQATTVAQPKSTPPPARQGADEARKTRSSRDALSALGLHGFSIVLVVGDMQAPSSGADNVPGAAKKALADMRDFLPYKNYRLLDAGWVLCCGSGFGGVSARLRGSEESEYSYSLSTVGVSDSKVTVHFSLRELPGVSEATPAPTSDSARASYSQQLYEVQKERDEAERQAAQLKHAVEVGTAQRSDYEAAVQKRQRAEARAEELRRTLGAAGSRSSSSRSVMDSTFAIAVGETVVIGTSRLKGDKALIALLTAANKPSPSR